MRHFTYAKVLACCLLFSFALIGVSVAKAQGNVFVSQTKGYTIESLGSTYTQGLLISALDQGDWDNYRKATQPVTFTFDDGSVITLHAANTRPNAQSLNPIPDQDVIAERVLSIAPSGAILMLYTTQISKRAQ